MASFALPGRAYVLLLTIPLMSDGELVEALQDPDYEKLRYEISLTMANRVRSGRVNPDRFREVRAGAVRDAIESVECHA